MRSPRFWWEKPGLLTILLAPFSAIYGTVAGGRLAKAGTRVGIPVICVGNPTVGGAGKTPTALAIARLLIAVGDKPAFLTRGYGGKLAGPVMVTAAHRAADVGDEPLLLARVATTIVARDRVAGARLAKEKGASVIVMDDGFQNPSLAKDISILVVDGVRGLGNGHVFPAGPLRAPLGPQLARASAILVIGDGPGLEDLPEIPAVPIFHATLEPDVTSVAALKGTKVLAFAGIGDPEKFFATLDRAGIEAQSWRPFADHHRYDFSDAAGLLAEAKRLNLQLVTTEKDRARLTGNADLASLAAQTRTLPVTLQVAEVQAFGKMILSRLSRHAGLSRPG